VEYDNRCYKLQLPSGRVVDILEPVVKEIENYLQKTEKAPESCGFLLGYENNNTHNITISGLTTPQKEDIRTRFFCRLHERFHFRGILEHKKKQNYYMGVWHTHPQGVPTPSTIDYNDWKDTLRNERTACDYVFFIIAGTVEFKLWAGEFTSGRIIELHEVERVDGLYAYNGL